MGKEVLATGKITFNAVPYGILSEDFNKAAAEIDLTDTATTVGDKEYRTGRVDKTFSGTMWKNVNLADPPVGDNGGAGYACELDFEGYTYDGTAYLSEVNNTASVDEGIQMSVSGRFVGTVTETPVP